VLCVRRVWSVSVCVDQDGGEGGRREGGGGGRRGRGMGTSRPFDSFRPCAVCVWCVCGVCVVCVWCVYGVRDVHNPSPPPPLFQITGSVAKSLTSVAVAAWVCRSQHHVSMNDMHRTSSGSATAILLWLTMNARLYIVLGTMLSMAAVVSGARKLQTFSLSLSLSFSLSFSLSLLLSLSPRRERERRRK
jgi:hypothetical protein